MTNALISELRQETATTRRVLERVPGEHLSWSPHAKSMTLGQLALHVAMLPRGITDLVRGPTGEIPDVPLPEPASVEEVLSTLDESVELAEARLGEWGDAGLREEWRLVQGEETLLRVPRVGMLRSIMLNHTYHHRGQLTVYLRLLDVPVPPVYGSTADEDAFG